MDECIIDAVIHLTFPLLPEIQLRNRCKNGHCEKRSDEAISKCLALKVKIASLRSCTLWVFMPFRVRNNSGIRFMRRFLSSLDLKFRRNNMNYQREYLQVIFCFTLALLLPVAGSAAVTNMTAAEIVDLLSSNTLSGWDEEQRPIHLYYGSNGVTKGKRIRKGVHFDSGNWTTTDEGQYCQQWNRWLRKELVCFYIWPLGDNKYRLKSVSGKYSLRFRLRHGDPESLRAN